MTYVGRRRRLSFRVSEELKIRRALLAERLGSQRYSWPALNELDRKVMPYLPDGPGTFLEIGANDGYSQSNTWQLERARGWKGILIEPLPSLFRVCQRTRGRSTCFNVACVGDPGTTSVKVVDRALESVTLNQQDSDEERGRLEGGGGRLRQVPARTLSSLIDESPMESITFMSVDVEGAELAVFGGVDWERHTPDWMLVETDNRDAVLSACPTLRFEAQLSFHDYLLRRG